MLRPGEWRLFGADHGDGRFSTVQIQRIDLKFIPGEPGADGVNRLTVPAAGETALGGFRFFLFIFGERRAASRGVPSFWTMVPEVRSCTAA
jgi:hypothetical protein